MYNRAIVVGRITADPELKQTPNGVSVCTFTVACERAYSKGEKVTDFLEVVAWRQSAEFVAKYFRKGQAMLVEGSIQTRSYTDKNEQKRRVWEIVAENIRFVESKNATKPADVTPEAPNQQAANDFAELDDDGDLPF